MKKSLIFSGLLTISLSTFSQILKFSKDAIAPGPKRLISGITFPGVIGPNYYVDEINGGGSFFDGGLKSNIYAFDINTLAKTNEIVLNRQVNVIKADDYINVRSIQFNDKLLTFFISKDDDKLYPVYYQSFDADGKMLKEAKTELTIDNTKLTKWNNKRDHATFAAASFNVKKTFDGKKLIAATVSKTIDKNKSVVSIAEWDQNMQATFYADYNIPLAKHMRYTKTILGKMGDNDDFNAAQVVDVTEDKNGFIYIMVQSDNPANSEDENLAWIYQFKKDDKNYFKSYRTEIFGHMVPINIDLTQSEDGNMYVTTVGEDGGETNKRNYFRANSYFIGTWGADGKLTKLLGGPISMDLLDFFDASDDKKQKKEDYINGLGVQDVHVNSDGGIYLVWEQQVKYTSGSIEHPHDYTISGNILVQYFKNNKKPIWEKQVFKTQESKDLGAGRYSGNRCFFKNDDLFIFYPDDSQNSSKDIADKKVEKFTLVKFGNKDLAGFFALSFNNKGLMKRNYFAWPDGKSGFALNLQSIYHIGGTEFVAAARKLNQGALAFEEKEFTVLRFSL